jgi:6-phosphogluconolactonase (cycloisomerase 2 family)
VQYAWRHPSLSLLYVAISDRFSRGGDYHGIAILRIDPRSGRLMQEGSIHRLHNRPVHLAVNRAGNCLAVAYNDPSEVSIYRLDRAGKIEPCGGALPAQVGTYAHQARFAPNDYKVIVAARGNDATATRAEDAGSLEILQVTNGHLEYHGAVAPSGGMGFGPRHVDFHPNGKWMYVSVERQNELQMFRLDDRSVESQPAFVRSTLSSPRTAGSPQLAGAVHVSRDGRFVYVTNRADGKLVARPGRPPVFAGGENNVAVFAIDHETGEPTPIQYAAVHGFHPRTCALHPDGHMLVAATLSPMHVTDSQHGGVRRVEAGLSAFRIDPDGRLTGTQIIEIATGDQWLFWCGMVRRSA